MFLKCVLTYCMIGTIPILAMEYQTRSGITFRPVRQGHDGTYFVEERGEIDDSIRVPSVPSLISSRSDGWPSSSSSSSFKSSNLQRRRRFARVRTKRKKKKRLRPGKTCMGLTVFIGWVRTLQLLRDRPITVPTNSIHKIVSDEFLPEIHEESIRILVANGGDINAKNQHGQTPLFVANIESIDLLLELGANTCIADNEGKNIFHYIALESLWCLEKYGWKKKKAINYKIAEVILAKTNKGINQKDCAGSSPLAYISKSRDPKEIRLARLFLKHGADLDEQDFNNAEGEMKKFLEEYNLAMKSFG